MNEESPNSEASTPPLEQGELSDSGASEQRTPHLAHSEASMSGLSADFSTSDVSAAPGVQVSGEEASAGNTTITVSDQDEPQEEVRSAPATVINDVDKARVVAYAEKGYRDKAARNRAIERESDEYIKKQAELRQVEDERHKVYKSPQQFSGIQRLKLKLRHKGLRREVSSLALEHANKQARENGETYSQFQEEFSRTSRKDDPERVTANAYDPQIRAEHYDEQASRIGDWMSALYDHPLSQEFLESHSDIPPDPTASAERLVRLENNAAALERIIARNEHEGAGTMLRDVNIAIEGRNSGTINPMEGPSLQDLLKHATEDEIAEYKKQTGKVRKSSGKLDELHNLLFDRQETQMLRDQVVIIRDLLNDVRREAGLPVEGDEAQPQADTPDQPPTE